MGNILTSGENNDDLVDTLRLLGYIKTKGIERVFRAVDRGDYVLTAHRDGAYKDVSWKMGNIHLSAPCVYSKVMEGLSLQSGQSFLNLGSGTGYLSTMAGLILGHNGTNHGIELNEDCMEYAYKRLEEFKQKSLALDEFDFCEPVFVHGNCLKVVPNRQYDRVYCGAACPESHEAFIKQFVKVGGILVMPYKDHLLRIERVDTDTWRHKAMLPVAFASLVIPNDEDQSIVQLSCSEPLSLQDLCRCKIRNALRKKVRLEHPELGTKDPIRAEPNQGTNSPPPFPLTSYIHPQFGRPDNRTSSDDEDDGMPSSKNLLLHLAAHPSRTFQVVSARTPSKTSESTMMDHSEGSDDDDRSANKKVSIDSSFSSSSDGEEEKKEESKHEEEKEPTEEEKESPMVIDDNDPHTSRNEHQAEVELKANRTRPTCTDTFHILRQTLPFSIDVFLRARESAKSAVFNPRWVAVNRSNDNVDDSDCQLENNDSAVTENSESQIGVKSCDNSATSSNGKRDIPNKLKKSADSGGGTSGEKCDLESQPETKKGRKLLSKEELGYDYSTGSNENELNDETSQECSSPSSAKNSKSENSHKSETSDSFTVSTDDDEDEDIRKITKRKTNRSHKCGIPNFAFPSPFPAFDLDVSDNEGNSPEASGLTVNSGGRPHQTFAHNLDINAFSQHMKSKISQLPVPVSLQLYINYHRALQ